MTKNPEVKPTVTSASLADLQREPAAMRNNYILVQQGSAARLLRVKVIVGSVFLGLFGIYIALLAQAPLLVAIVAPVGVTVCVYLIANYILEPQYEFGNEAIKQHKRSVKEWEGVGFDADEFDFNDDGTVSPAELTLFAEYVKRVHMGMKPTQAQFRAWARAQKGWALGDEVWDAFTYVMAKAIIGHVKDEEGRNKIVRLIKVEGKREERKLNPLSERFTTKEVQEANLAWYLSESLPTSPRRKERV